MSNRLLSWFTWRRVRRVILIVLCLSSFILTYTLGDPFARDISFLKVFGSPAQVNANSTTNSSTNSSSTINLGAFGWCGSESCSQPSLPYEYGPSVNSSLTGAMVLWPLAAIAILFTFLGTVLSLLLGSARAPVGMASFLSVSLSVTVIVSSVAWLLSVFGWSIARRSFYRAGAGASLGSAIWLGLAAALCTVPLAILGWPSARSEPADASDRQVGDGIPRPPPAAGYFHYRRTTREIVPQ